MRHLIDTWEQATADEDKLQRVRDIIDGQELLLFFQSKGNIYGAPEESRIVFAKMKHPDEEVSDEWIEDASFSAMNLTRALNGERSENIFSVKDMDDIAVISPDVVEDRLLSKAKKTKNVKALNPKKHGEDGANKHKLRDRS